MNQKNNPSLYLRASQQKVVRGSKLTSMQVTKMSMLEIQQFVNELQARQSELEMQNEELRRSQIDLQEARDYYAHLYDFVPVGFLTLNSGGDILDANFMACQFLGVERKVLLHQKLETYVISADQPTLRLHLKNVAKTHIKDVSEVLQLKHSHAHFLVRLHSLYEETSSFHSEPNVRIVLIDFTEQERAKTLQREQEALLGGVLDTAMDAIITVDEQQRILLFNKGAVKIFRCPSSKAIGMSIDQFIPQRFRKIHGADVKRFVQSGDTVRSVKSLGNLSAVRADGEEFPIEASISQFVVAGKRRLTVILRDITARKKVQEALEKEQQFISTILDTAGALVLVLDPEWRIVRFNRACETLTGRDIEEMKGKSFIDLSVVSGEDVQEVKNLLVSFKGRQFPKSFESAWVDQDRQLHWIRWSNTVVADKDGKIENIIATGIDITNRKKAEQALRREQNFMSAVLDTAGALMVVFDRYGKIVRFNRACEELTGYTFLDVQGKPLWDFLLLPEETPVVKKIFEDLRNEARSNQFENHWITKDDAIRQISWSNTILANDRGEVEHVIGIGIDVTEQRKAQQEVHRLWKQNELILNSAWEGIYGIDANGKGTFFNDGAEKLTGWTLTEVQGQDLHSLLHHTKSDGISYQWEDCPVYSSLQHGKVQKVDTEVLWRKDGTSFQAEYFCTPIVNENQKIDGAVVTFTDITDRKNSEAALRESEERFQAFMNHSPVVAFLKNEKGQYLYVNQQWEEKIRLSREDCLGKTDHQLFPAEVARMFKEHDQEALEASEVLEIEETTLDETGQVVYWWVMKFPVQSKEGQVLIGGVALDITTRKAMEESLRLRESELQESHKRLRALGGQLITAQEDERRRISRELHDDMNQRLAVLALNIQSAQKGLGKSTSTYLMLQKLYEGVSFLSDDVRRLAYQLHPSILDDLGLEVAIRSFVEDFSKWEDIPIAFDATDVPFPQSQEMASCLYRVTQECLRNVARHAKATQVDVKLIGRDNGLTLSIKDNGKGFRVDKIRKGKVGLGLVGIEERIRTVQGTYKVNSSPGQGTEVTVWIPPEKGKRKKRRVKKLE